jgi:uncharacterized protein (UPF0332 family)
LVLTLLEEKEMEPPPGWITAFKEHFVDTGKVPQRFFDGILGTHRLNALAQKHAVLITREMAEKALKSAEGFLDIAKRTVEDKRR